MINFNQIIDPIEKALLLWAQHYSLTTPLKSINDLTNAQFFILHLAKIKSFKFTEPCNFANFGDLGVGQRIVRMKVIGRSIIRHYKSYLMKDIGNTDLNYVQMCTQNKSELMKLLILFMGIIVTDSNILQQLESFIANSNEESLTYLNIMLDYAKKMNYSQQTTDSPIKKQKRLITKLQILEDQIQFYEDYTKQLQLKVQQLVEDATKHQKKIVEYQQRKECMVSRIEQLQVTNQQMAKEVNKRISNQGLLSAKLLKNRQLADQTIDRLLKDIDKLKEEIAYYQQSLLKYQHVQATNKHLATINTDLHKQLQALRNKIDKNMNTLHKKDIQLQSLTKINNTLLLQNDGLKVKIDLIQKSFAKNRQLSYSPQQKSIVIHNPLSLSSSSQNNFTWFNFQSNQDEVLNDSLTLTLRSNASFSQHPKKCHSNKQNEMGMGNMQQSQLNKIGQQQSFELNMDHINLLMKLKQQRDVQFQFCIQIIGQIYDYMQGLRKQLKKYQMKEAKQLSRALQFKQHVNNMFK